MRNSLRTDISQIGQAKINIPLSEYTDLKEEIKKVKYPTYAFSNAEDLGAKIQTFKSDKVREKLAAELKSLNSYRKVRGDGNCFFRALGFCFISQEEIPSYYNCFQLIDQVNLTCCYPDSIPKQFRKFYDHKFLAATLKKEWETTFAKYMKDTDNNKKKTLLKLLDENPYLDFILILYFRAVCLKALYNFQDEYRDFISGDQQKSIRTYSEETEGISLKLCSKILEVTIFVYEVRKQEINSYHYDISKIDKNRHVKTIYLLFYESHYDILEHNTDIQSEKSTLKKKQTYYGQVNQVLKPGTCIECGTYGHVYQISKLCLKCHEYSLTSLNNFKKDKFIRAKCTQCLREKDNVSTSFGLCQSCIQVQNEAQERRKNFAMMQSKKKKCALCGIKSFVDDQTFLCEHCLKSQQKMMNDMISSRKPPTQSRSPNKDELQQQINGQKQNEKKSRINNGQKPELMSKIRDKDQSYDVFKCKKCSKLVLNGALMNGYCMACK